MSQWKNAASLSVLVVLLAGCDKPPEDEIIEAINPEAVAMEKGHVMLQGATWGNALAQRYKQGTVTNAVTGYWKAKSGKVLSYYSESTFPTGWVAWEESFIPWGIQFSDRFESSGAWPVDNPNLEGERRKTWRNVEVVFTGDDADIVKRLPQSEEIPALQTTFVTEKEGVEEFACETDVRSFEFSDAGRFFHGSGELNWSAASATTGTRKYRLMVNYDERKWSMTRPNTDSTLPFDANGDGEIWDRIPAGSDQYICLDTTAGGLWSRKVTCLDQLDMETMTRRKFVRPKLSHPKLVNGNGDPLPVSFELFTPYRTLSLVPGSTEVEIGSCRKL